MTSDSEFFQTEIIQGSAGTEGTADYFNQTALSYPDYRESSWKVKAGSTGWTVSRMGFGCYRVSKKSRMHSDALRSALLCGTNVIDTSTNYSGGESEMLVGDVMRELIKAGRIRREGIVVISKAGYIQGELMSLLKNSPDTPPEITKYSRDVWHCMHRDFLESQLKASMKRLGLACIDVYLLHNPEYFLMEQKAKGTDPTEALSEYEDRIRSALEAMEEFRSRGWIQYYGISSNTFPAAPDDCTATRLDRILEFAPPGFKVIQFPGNILENDFRYRPNNPSGTLSALAEKAALWTICNRPLNAMYQDKRLIRLSRLVDQPPDEGMSTTAELERLIGSLVVTEEQILSLFSGQHFFFDERNMAMSGIVKHYRDAFNNAEHLRSSLPSIAEAMQKTINHLSLIASAKTEQYVLQNYTRLINAVTSVWENYTSLRHNARMARLENSLSAASLALNGKPLAQQSVMYLLSGSCPATVLVGMRKPQYVDQLADIYRSTPPGPAEGMNIISAAEEAVQKLVEDL